jgi:hypothetical protein
MAKHSSPKRGRSAKTFPEDKDASPEDKPSMSQADGDASAAPGPSGPANGTEGAMTNMGSITEGLPENPNMNSFGEVGEPTGKGNIDIHPETFEAAEPGQKADKKSASRQPKKKDRDKAA